jgi:hypothetical protein
MNQDKGEAGMEARAADGIGQVACADLDERNQGESGESEKQIHVGNLKNLLKLIGYSLKIEGKIPNLLTYVACLPDAAWIQRSGCPTEARLVLIRRIRAEIPFVENNNSIGKNKMNALHCAISGNPDLSVELIDCIESEFYYHVEDIDEIGWDCGMHLAHRIRYSGGYPNRTVVSRIFKGKVVIPPRNKDPRPLYWDEKSDYLWWFLLRYSKGEKLGQ